MGAATRVVSDRVDQLIIDLSIRNQNINRDMSTSERQINRHRVELDEASQVVRGLHSSCNIVG